jgi:hypothetical protein
MKLDADKFKTDESRSNPMVVAQQYAGCPINEICVYVVVGFGTIAEQCKYFKDEKDSAYCLYGTEEKEAEDV